ncbi:ABC transporter ATP-binding protein [Embleya sp. AB8]|uniref:ABC transporter ATP-binding protein n=1 Tax=Embleya sp. AB8 TaxID=3156304 RepID=UPI003C718443
MAVVEAVRVEGLSKGYPGKSVLRDVSFAVAPGEIFGLVGPNGAGKTTTVECVAGLRRGDSGTVRVLGLDPWEQGEQVRHVLGVQLQESALPDKLRVSEAIELYAATYRAPVDPAPLLTRLGLDAHRRTAYTKLSGGLKQRLSIALALLGGPRVVILDELTTGLDPQARRDTWSLVEEIRDAGVTVLLVTHFMEEAERLCDRVAVLDGGHIVALDTPEALIRRVADTQSVRFRTRVPLAPELHAELAALPQVSELTVVDGQVLILGTADVLTAVTAVLARAGVIAENLRVDSADLDDAYLALTRDRA